VRLDLYVGLADRNGNVFGKDERFKAFLDDLTELTGGLSVMDQIGRYKNREGKIIEEPSVVITIFGINEDQLSAVKEIVRNFLKETDQESAVLVRDLVNPEFIEV